MPKIVNPHFVKPPEKWSESLEYPVEYKLELKSLEAIHIKHEPSNEGKRSIRHWINRSKYPEHTHTTLCRIVRVKIRPDQFEQPDGSVQPDKSPKQTIVASFSEYTDNSDFINQGGATGLEKISGEYYTKFRYPKHLGKFTYDENGNIVDSRHVGTKLMYTKAYSPGAIRELLENYEHDTTLSFSCAVSNDHMGGGGPYLSNPRTIKNLREFIEIEDIDGLIEANDSVDEHKKSFLTEEYGGYNRYQKIKQEKIAAGQPAEKTTTDNNSRRASKTGAS